MKEDTLSRHVKDSLEKTADALQKQCYFLKQQVDRVESGGGMPWAAGKGQPEGNPIDGLCGGGTAAGVWCGTV